MFDTTPLKAYYGKVFDIHAHILGMSAYEMISYLQAQFNHKENDIAFDDKDALEKAFRLLVSENNETRNDGLTPKNLNLIRDGIGDQLTIAYFLGFKVDGLKDESFSHITPLVPASYTEYCAEADECVNKLSHALLETNNKELAQEAYVQLLANLYNIPEFSRFDPTYDLIDITFSSLSKICPDMETAEATLESYKNKGYVVHIDKVPSGYAIFVSEDCVVNGEAIPKGKFLKSIHKLDPMLTHIDEDTVW